MVVLTKRTRLITTLILLATSSCGLIWYAHVLRSHTPKPTAPIGGNHSLIFNDEFNGTHPNTSAWNTCYEWYNAKNSGCSNYGNDESEWYSADNVTLANGALQLTAKRKSTIGVDKSGSRVVYDYSSGMVSSGRPTLNAPAKWQGGYGYYEARMKVPAGQAIWPAFWLLPTDHIWPPEIDVMELLGDHPSQILTTYFWKDTHGQQAKDSSVHSATKSYALGWHTYGVNWRKGSIDWYIDGQKVKSVRSVNVPSKNMQIIFNLAVGGKLPGYPDATTPSTATMSVDYVRVFK